MSRRTHVSILIGFLLMTNGCGNSDEEIDNLKEDSYNQGWYDAMDCVKRKGGSADSAVAECK